jgi:hypothetical protein
MTGLACIGWENRSPLFIAWATLVLGAALAVAPTLAFAGAKVRGTSDAVSVEAKDASVGEILVALTNSFDVHFRSSANLEKRLTGTYAGSLRKVVTQILGGYDFVMKSGETGLEITLLGSGKAVDAVGAPPIRRQADSTAHPSPAAGPAPIASPTGPSPTISVAKGPPPILVLGPRLGPAP